MLTPHEYGAYGHRLAAVFSPAAGVELATTTLKAATLAVTRLTSREGMTERTLPIPAERAYLVMLQLCDVPQAELWLGERMVTRGALPEGSICIVPLDGRRPSFRLPSAVDMRADVYIPQVAFDELAPKGAALAGELTGPFAVEDRSCANMDARYCPRSRPINTRTTCSSITSRGLCMLICHALRPCRTHVPCGARAADRLAGASREGNAACRFGARTPHRRHRAGLSHGRESIRARIPKNHRLSAAPLAANRFVRAFRKTTGFPPHRWLRSERVERAKDLLFGSSLALSQIAYDCGFADQSHLTRVFADLVGTTPGAWRQARRGSDAPLPQPLPARSVRRTLSSLSESAQAA